jgi:hypothetical protein
MVIVLGPTSGILNVTVAPSTAVAPVVSEVPQT